jgi:hypothetical protein
LTNQTVGALSLWRAASRVSLMSAVKDIASKLLARGVVNRPALGGMNGAPSPLRAYSGAAGT